jgi:hypothetical protein
MDSTLLGLLTTAWALTSLGKCGSQRVVSFIKIWQYPWPESKYPCHSLGTGFLYYSHRYPIRPCSLNFYKGNKWKHIRNIKRREHLVKSKGTGRMGLHLVHARGHCLFSCMDPLWFVSSCSFSPECWYKVGTLILHTCFQSTQICKGNLTDLRRELHLSLAKGNPK